MSQHEPALHAPHGESYSVVRITLLLIHSPAVSVGAVLSIAAVSIHVPVSVWSYIFVPPGCIPGRERRLSWGLYLTSGELPDCFPKRLLAPRPASSVRGSGSPRLCYLWLLQTS